MGDSALSMKLCSKLSEYSHWLFGYFNANCRNPVKARVSAFTGFRQFDKIRLAVWTIYTDYMTLSYQKP